MLDLNDLRPRESDGHHVTHVQVRAIERYVAKLLRKLDLNYWRVYVAKDEPPEGARLMIEPTDGRRVAMLYVSTGWWDEVSADEKRKNNNGDVGAYPMSLVWEQFKVETERMVDSLSYVIAPFMPRWQAPRTKTS